MCSKKVISKNRLFFHGFLQRICKKRGLPRVCGQASQKYSAIGEENMLFPWPLAERVFFDYSDAFIAFSFTNSAIRIPGKSEVLFQN